MKHNDYMAHIGKIGRLPEAVQTELNRRLNNHEPGGPLLAWLNGLPEVQQMLAKLFDGKPVSKQNLSQWHRGGFREWQVRREAVEAVPEMLAELKEWEFSDTESMSDRLAPWAMVNFFMNAQRKADGLPNGEEKFKLLRTLCSDLSALRRNDHRAERLKFEREKVAFKQERRQRTIADLLEGVKGSQSQSK